ncbi:hypothetical protein LWI29_038427 [Acer saccharum]|uniref:Uncharacterized protein n=1 Tax=Acer saccharum TaxID=4024 RepID=A0AA39SC33_ACESA|nr:hypothetical protein LWI29_038427 [Acer saccharum]
MKEVAIDYFVKLFTTHPEVESYDNLPRLFPSLEEGVLAVISRGVKEEEVKDALFGIGGLKAPACGRLFMCSVLPNSIKWRELLLLLRPIAPPKFSMLLLNFVISFVHRCFTSSLIYCSCTASRPSKRRNSIREDRADCLVLIAAH